MTREDKVFLASLVLAAIEMMAHKVLAEDLDDEEIQRRAVGIVRIFEGKKA